MSLGKINIAIADDHQIVIDGIKSLLKSNQFFQVVLECTQPEMMPELLANKKVDVLLTDIMMPVMNGAELAKIVKSRFPEIKILALSMSGEGALVNQMIDESNISGYVLKNIGQEELVHAIQKISSGGVYFSKEVLAEMIRDAEKRKVPSPEIPLTIREVEIIKLMEQEMNNRQIADKLFISERTVETHRKNIYRKTKTSSLLGLVKYAYEHKIANSTK